MTPLLPVVLAAAALPAPAVRWVAPLDRLEVVRRFDPPASDYGPGHRGVDLAGAAGDVVRAAGAGVVSFAADLAGRGVVVVRHGELRTTYEPVTPLVEVGDEVAAGEALGKLATGRPHPGRPEAGARLHWGLRRGDDYLDPLALLGLGPVRLYPVWELDRRPAWGGASGGGGRPVGAAPLAWVLAGGGLAGAGVSPWARRACRAAAARPWCASGRSGSRSRRGPGRSPRA
jgi:murein DD-endopeptidase MepM/ murein hydrolase activator NlpD